MREIKFRAWSKDLKTFIRPDYRTGICGEIDFIWDSIIGSCGENIILIGDVVNAEVMQFTGLRDRDGKEIYEGDILTDDAFGTHPITVDGTHGYRFMWGKDQLVKANATFGAVVGNIYENPELLPEEERGAR